jgi:hypothetical protein
MAQTRRWSVAGAPNRTTEMAHRDKRASQPESPLNKPVSGSVSADFNRQHPANSRAFLDPSSDPKREVSAPTDWVAVEGVRGQLVSRGWSESGGGELVSGGGSLFGRENTGHSSNIGSAERIRPEIAERFRAVTSVSV